MRDLDLRLGTAIGHSYILLLLASMVFKWVNLSVYPRGV